MAEQLGGDAQAQAPDDFIPFELTKSFALVQMAMELGSGGGGGGVIHSGSRVFPSSHAGGSIGAVKRVEQGRPAMLQLRGESVTRQL